ncbi:MAG: DinB family protein [Clostridia bacterium]
MDARDLQNQYDMVRGNTLAYAKHFPPEMTRIVPDGFNNNILWNLGHILTVQEMLLFFTKEPEHLPQSYLSLFGKDTKPADWPDDVPSVEVIVQHLEEQIGRIKDHFFNRLDENLPQPFKMRGKEISTYGEMIMFSLYHEGMHTGYMMALKRALEKQAK